MHTELLHKVERHDNSITEAEKIEFRKSEEWRNFRNQVAERQEYKDYITGQPLSDYFNCHHMCMINSQYKNLKFENFIVVNQETHKTIHELFKPGWQDRVAKNSQYYNVLQKMEELNDDVEIVLYDNKIDYNLTDPANKFRNMELAREYSYPINDKGYLQWNHNYIPSGYPQDTADWCKYMAKINNNYTRDFMKLILELRHINLYSSYKNFRNNPNIRQNTKDECRKELEMTTKILRKYFGY